MNLAQKILVIMGIAYIAIGGAITVIFSGTGFHLSVTVIPLLFVVVGAVFLLGVAAAMAGKKKIVKKGRRYAAKIYGYVENSTLTVNGQFTVNIKVHYFDENHVEREAILPTSFTKGSDMYPIGMTIDIFEYRGRFDFDPKSVRNEILPGEAELMDDKPVEPEKLRLIAVSCPNCGSNFQAAAGYSSKCPYCGGYVNAG